MSPKVSVILPVYNRSSSLEDSMLSVLNQSYSDLELIVVDDGSQEDLEPIVTAVQDPRVVFIRRAKNGGASAARNTGLAAAKGAFIAFQDSDDLWLPRKLANQMAFLEAHPEYDVIANSKILYGGAADGSYGPSKVSMRPPPHRIMSDTEDQVRKYLGENRISLQNTLFRRDCYTSMVWFDEITRSNADWAFTSSLAQHARIYEDPHPVVLGFSSTDSISKLKKAKAIGLIRIVKRNREVYRKYPQAYGRMMWQIARILSRFGKSKMARKFYIEGLKNNPGFILDALRERYMKRRIL